MTFRASRFVALLLAATLALSSGPLFAQGRDRDRSRGGDKPDGGRKSERPQGGGGRQTAPRTAPAHTPNVPRAVQQTPRAVQQPPRAVQQPPRAVQQAPRAVQQPPHAAQPPQRSRPQASPSRQVPSGPSAPNAALRQTPNMRNFSQNRDSYINRAPVQSNRPAQPPVALQNRKPNVQPSRQPTFARPESGPKANSPDQHARQRDATRPNIARPGIDHPSGPRPRATRRLPTCGGPIHRTPPLRGQMRSAATSIARTLIGPTSIVRTRIGPAHRQASSNRRGRAVAIRPPIAPART